jgi:hypothetical protein
MRGVAIAKTSTDHGASYCFRCLLVDTLSNVAQCSHMKMGYLTYVVDMLIERQRVVNRDSQTLD